MKRELERGSHSHVTDKSASDPDWSELNSGTEKMDVANGRYKAWHLRTATRSTEVRLL